MSRYDDKQRIYPCQWGHADCAREPGGTCREYPTEQTFIDGQLCKEFRDWLRNYVSQWYDLDYTDAQAEMNRMIETYPLVDPDELSAALDGEYQDFEQTEEERELEEEEE